MAKLIFLLDGNVIKEYALDKERMTIGRRASNDIHIDNLAISGEHAAIVTVDGSAFIEDLNSTNGTLVNKKQVKKETLKHGDDIGLGKYKLRYVKDDAVSPNKVSGFADTVLVTPKSEAEEKYDSEPAAELSQVSVEPDVTAEQGDQQMHDVANEVQEKPAETDAAVEKPSVPKQDAQGPRLEILNGENAGNALMLDKSMVKVGQPGQQMAVVTKREDAYFITHVSGDNHPFVNGKQIGAQACALHNNDEIEVLDTKMAFHLD